MAGNKKKAEKRAPDVAFNSGTSIVVGGADENSRTLNVREIRWKRIKAHSRDIHALVVALVESNPDVDWTQITSSDAVQVIFKSVLPMLDGITGLLDGLVADATDLTQGEIDELTLSDYQRLLAVVMEEQQAVIGDFFALRDVAKGLVGGARK